MQRRIEHEENPPIYNGILFKHAILNVFLAGLITVLGYNSKMGLNCFLNTKNSRTLK